MSYAQNPIWGWIENPPGTPGPRAWVYAKYDINDFADYDPQNHGIGANMATAPKFIPKIKHWRGLAIMGDLVVTDQHYKQGHRGGINMLYANWSAQWVPVQMLMPEWKNVPWATYPTTYTTAMNVPIHRVWRKISLQSGELPAKN